MHSWNMDQTLFNLNDFLKVTDMHEARQCGKKKKMTKVRKKQWVTGGDKKEQMKVKERKTGNDLHAESTLNEKELK